MITKLNYLSDRSKTVTGMKRIIVPTDFSDCAGRALNYAVYLSKKSGAEIILVHVCDLLEDGGISLKKIIREYNEAKIMELSAALEALKKSVEKHKVVIRTKLYHGKVVSSILDAAKENHADLIVLGTLGATGLKALFFGTKAAAVINESKLPVITVPYDYKKPALKEILIAIDDARQSAGIFEPVFSLRKLALARVSTIVFTEEISNLGVKARNARAVNQVKKRLEAQFGYEILRSVNLHGKDFHRSIQHFMEKNKTDLLVMVTKRRTFMEKLIRGSMTRRMAYKINIPLLTLKSSEKS